MLPLWRWHAPRPPVSFTERRRRYWTLRGTRHALGLAALFVGAVGGAWLLVVAIFYAVITAAGLS